jgi:uncharacterized membrane protein YbhN (UPF0104 family)
LASAIVQVVLVVIALIVTGDSFSAPGGPDQKAIVRLILVVILVAGIAVIIGMVVPRLRKAIKGIVKPQLDAAINNLRGILSTPRKAVMLFGGNVCSQVLYAIVLDCSLHAFGGSLPLLQLILINSLASVVGGLAPVPGGMGVIEAGLIAGLTAAGIPQETAVATVFTHRLFTAYLPPIWGWFSLQWLRRNDYV